MGNCGSSSVPDVIIPDPTPGQKCHVLFKKTGMFARDQNVFMDCDKEKKWLMMDKEGSFFSNPTYVLENFVRKVDEKGKQSKRGECLCAAKLKITECKTYGHETHEDSDSSSEDSSDGEVTEEVTKMKWAQAVKVEFFSDREMKDEIATLKVKAKGKAKRTKITKEVEDHDDEGNVTGTHEEISYEFDKKIKKVKYMIKELKGEEEMPKVTLEGKPNKSAYKLKWAGDVFQAEIESSNWGAQEIEVKTEFKNPALGMLMGYITAKEISPDDILDKVSCW